jgi:hypothetical protein
VSTDPNDPLGDLGERWIGGRLGQPAHDDTDYARDYQWLGQPRGTVMTTPTNDKPLALVYIAGPFRAETPYGVRRNVERARDLGFHVAVLGGYPIIPHTMTCDFDKCLTDQFWLDGTMALLRVCHAVVLESRWAASRGARAEKLEAERLGLAVFDTAAETRWPLQFADWLALTTFRPPAGIPQR